MLNITEVNNITDDTIKGIKASPEKVETELIDRIKSYKERAEEEVEDLFRSEWDLRPTDFNCNNDDMEGELYMIDKIIDINDELKKEY